ncbi:undecaprenyl/decaprenyl-phosphate alpha-N-acetylglucosaminyl 1-phosphate transferase [Helicobacter sp. MIT 99-5507]|nr:undecaprenyl/decaprenyl-phosphate alpha-N-acetylglucosaminyl 1-phosphate transferase [Helicobacter sp. MIT 99-5507]
MKMPKYEIVYFCEVFFLSLIIAFVVDSFIIRYAQKSGLLLDRDSSIKPQKMHYGDIPRAGGIGIFLALCFIIFFGLKYFNLLLFIPICLVFLSGVLEDIKNSLSPKQRLLLQVLASISAIYFFDCVITDIGLSLPYYIGVIFSVFCIVGIINAINIIDGFNGLAGGFSILALLSITFVSYIVGDIKIFYICIGLIGGILGFLLLNFPKGRIFLGDGGAYLVGFILAFLLILLTQNKDNGVSPWYGICIMIYPIFEVLFSIYRKKIIRSMSAMEPDSIHFHMLIYKRITRSNYKTSILIWILNIPFIFLPILFFDNTFMLIAISIVFIFIYLFIYFRIIKFAGIKLL